MPISTFVPPDFGQSPAYVKTKPVGDVDVYIQVSSGRFCALLGERGVAMEQTPAALARRVTDRGKFVECDAIIYGTEYQNSYPRVPRKVRLLGYRKNPKSGGRWQYRPYDEDGKRIAVWGGLTEHTSDVHLFTPEAWEAVMNDYRALMKARDHSAAFRAELLKMERPR